MRVRAPPPRCAPRAWCTRRAEPVRTLGFLETYVSNLAPLSGLPNQHCPSVVSAGKLEYWRMGPG